MKKIFLFTTILLILAGCTSGGSAAQCEINDVKKLSFFTAENDTVNKIEIEDYEIAIDPTNYEENKILRQNYLDMLNEVNGISASESLKGSRLTKKYTITFDQLDEEVRELLMNEYNFGNDMSLSTLVKNYETSGFTCK